MKDQNRKRRNSVDELTSAAAVGDLDQVKYLLSVGVDVNGRNSYGRTAIQVMAHNIPELATVLLHAGANPNVQDISTQDTGGLSTYRTICHDVAASGYLDTLHVLLKYGTDTNMVDRWGNTPAHSAAKAGHFKIVQYLACGMAMTAVNTLGSTPLDYLADLDDVACQQWIDKQRSHPKDLRTLSVIKVRQLLESQGLREIRYSRFRRSLKKLILLQDEDQMKVVTEG
ncbi:hypothetical protein SNE40_004990 [Patella caerulea]